MVDTKSCMNVVKYRKRYELTARNLLISDHFYCFDVCFNCINWSRELNFNKWVLKNEHFSKSCWKALIKSYILYFYKY